MPINASQQEIGRLRELIRNKSKSPAARVKHARTLWSNFPSSNNRRHIKSALSGVLKLAEEADRHQALELLTQMETFKPKAKPSCLERSQAEPAEPELTGVFWDDGPDPYLTYLFESIFAEPQLTEKETKLVPKSLLPVWDGFTTLEPRFRGRNFPKDVIEAARERISVLVREFGIGANGTASLESYRALEDMLWEKRSRLVAQRNLSLPSDDFEFVALTNSIADLFVAWLSHCRPEKKTRFGIEIPYRPFDARN